MSLEATTRTIDSYLNALFNGGDFEQYFTDDVRWTTMETGEEIQGREAVRGFIVAFHREMFDAKPEVRNLAIADGLLLLRLTSWVSTQASSRASPQRARLYACRTAFSMTSVRTASLPFAATCRSGRWSQSSKPLQGRSRNPSALTV